MKKIEMEKIIAKNIKRALRHETLTELLYYSDSEDALGYY